MAHFYTPSMGISIGFDDQAIEDFNATHCAKIEWDAARMRYMLVAESEEALAAGRADLRAYSDAGWGRQIA